ncbi:DUF819 family protein [Flavobacteriaceae bacterium]|nr:DUF819 family protein [Flavobacteriaceae bacterium]
MNTVIFDNDVLIFGLLMACLAVVFYGSSQKQGFWYKFYKVIPALLMCYLLPAILSSLGLIGTSWQSMDGQGQITTHQSELYNVAKNYLLPASLIMMTLSIDLKAVFNLGPKALIMFFTGTLGVIIGGPIALLIISYIDPSILGATGPDQVWRGLATIAGSWIGGGANQTAMYEIYGYNPAKYGAMVFVDIVVANIWMAVLLFGIGKRKQIDRWLKADNSAIEALTEQVSHYQKSVQKNPELKDYMILLGVAFFGVAIAHYSAQIMTGLMSSVESIQNPAHFLSFLNSSFFWMISTATVLGIIYSFTPLKQLEGVGASKIGSVFIYILVATIGMKMDLTQIFENPILVVLGLIWMLVHVALLLGVAKLIKAPYFFLAVGSKANIGGAASAPVIAAAFHPSLATVGVLLAVFGYAVGTFGAIFCAQLMELISTM